MMSLRSKEVKLLARQIPHRIKTGGGLWKCAIGLHAWGKWHRYDARSSFQCRECLRCGRTVEECVN